MTAGAARTIVLASRNPDKVRELREILDGLPFAVVGADAYPGLPDVVEDGTTILGNATRKAMAVAAYTGQIALADDTSLQVRELNEWPDIFAARFSGPDATYSTNVRLLLDLLHAAPPPVRQARFASACVWIDPRPAGAGGPGLQDFAPVPPAARRWLLNPWDGGRPYVPSKRGPLSEWYYWNTLLDRRREWSQYVAAMLADAVSFGGHDRARLLQVARGLLAECPDSPLYAAQGADDCGCPAGCIRVPDPRIWTVKDPAGKVARPSPFCPEGLPQDAPGRATAQDLWLEISAQGRLLGEIATQPLGGHGFGYDPVFVPQGCGCTLAELEAQRKHRISHRGLALRRLIAAVGQAYRV